MKTHIIIFLFSGFFWGCAPVDCDSATEKERFFLTNDRTLYPVFFLTSYDAELYHSQIRFGLIRSRYETERELAPQTVAESDVFDLRMKKTQETYYEALDEFFEDLENDVSVYYFEYDDRSVSRSGYCAIKNGRIIKESYDEFYY